MAMHADEFIPDVALVRRLLRGQFPAWAELPIAPVNSAGTDNALFRLGDALCVRMPRVPSAEGQVEKEQRWLPMLAPQLPLQIPEPVAAGQPGEGYPSAWSVCRWIEGRDAAQESLRNLDRVARQLAEFLRALWGTDATGGPPPGQHNSRRGVPLATRDAATRTAIAELAAMPAEPVDIAGVMRAWEASLAADVYAGEPCWIHGDMGPLNLVGRDGELVAVIDFGCLGVGDPACDLQVAWSLLMPESRRVFREALGVDDAAWERGRGWALSAALIALPYYRESNPGLAADARRRMEHVLGG